MTLTPKEGIRNLILILVTYGIVKALDTYVVHGGSSFMIIGCILGFLIVSVIYLFIANTFFGKEQQEEDVNEDGKKNSYSRYDAPVKTTYSVKKKGKKKK